MMMMMIIIIFLLLLILYYYSKELDSLKFNAIYGILLSSKKFS